MNSQSKPAARVARSGGRAARRAARAAPVANHLRSVYPGMEGGTLKPLTQDDMERIHQSALTALETIRACRYTAKWHCLLD